jgi:hypothetical protein
MLPQSSNALFEALKQHRKPYKPKEPKEYDELKERRIATEKAIKESNYHRSGRPAIRANMRALGIKRGANKRGKRGSIRGPIYETEQLKEFTGEHKIIGDTDGNSS